MATNAGTDRRAPYHQTGPAAEAEADTAPSRAGTAAAISRAASGEAGGDAPLSIEGQAAAATRKIVSRVELDRVSLPNSLRLGHGPRKSVGGAEAGISGKAAEMPAAQRSASAATARASATATISPWRGSQLVSKAATVAGRWRRHP